MSEQALEHVYANLLKIHQQMTQKLTLQAKKLGYNTTEYLIMLDIVTHPNTDLNAVCERLGMKKSAASKAVQKLVDKEEVVRFISADDRRRVELLINDTNKQTVCRNSAIVETFSGYETKPCDLALINKQLEEVLKMLI